MIDKELPFCPYCGRKLKYWDSFSVHRDGEYTCPKCNYNSKINYKKNIKAHAAVNFIISLVYVLLFAFVFKKVNIFEVSFVLVPFFVFYFFVPYQMLLNKTTQVRYNSYDQNQKIERIGETKVLPNINLKYSNVWDGVLKEDNMDSTIVLDIMEG